MFNLKTLIVVTATIVATTAFAQTPTPHVGGKGLAKNPENAAKFELRAGYNRNQELHAAFNITFGGEDAANRVHIELKRANELTFDHRNHKATLNGLAVLVVKRGDQLQRIEGRIQIEVADIVEPLRDTDAQELSDRRPHDRITVKFQAIDSNMTYSFEGGVLRGDINIGAPRRDR